MPPCPTFPDFLLYASAFLGFIAGGCSVILLYEFIIFPHRKD